MEKLYKDLGASILRSCAFYLINGKSRKHIRCISLWSYLITVFVDKLSKLKKKTFDSQLHYLSNFKHKTSTYKCIFCFVPFPFIISVEWFNIWIEFYHCFVKNRIVIIKYHLSYKHWTVEQLHWLLCLVLSKAKLRLILI